MRAIGPHHLKALNADSRSQLSIMRIRRHHRPANISHRLMNAARLGMNAQRNRGKSAGSDEDASEDQSVWHRTRIRREDDIREFDPSLHNSRRNETSTDSKGKEPLINADER
jgi:hypothetical protein